jgi:alpha-galactosidase/6-phospho-beta-glucosidase family protein
MTLSTNEITVICSDKIRLEIEKKISEKPVMREEGLASIGLSLDPKYYHLPNITFTLIRRIAKKHIPLAETITTRTEIIFVFNKKHLGQIVELFS